LLTGLTEALDSLPPSRTNWRRDAIIFALGISAGAIAILVRTWLPHGGGVIAEPCHVTEVAVGEATVSGTSVTTTTRSPIGPYAWVQMAYDPPGERPAQIYRVLPMARALHRLSRFSLVVLTNTTNFPDGTEVEPALKKLNAVVMPVHSVPIPAIGKMRESWRIAFWKLQIWRLTQFEKVVWLDNDAIIFRSMDWLFLRRPPWGQQDNWVCSKSNDKSFQQWLCSGLMLIEPSEDTYRDILKYAATGDRQWWTNGDQKLIRNYFQFVKSTPVRLLSTSDASFGRCLGQTPGLPYPSPGQWDTPAFVHKSSDGNECFDFDMAKQLKSINGIEVNICQYHPLGPYWRDLFCDAIRTVGVMDDTIVRFCNDFHWYRLAG